MRRAGRAFLAVLFTAATVLWGAGLPAYAADVGSVGPVYGTSTSAPTGQKPQSKLWVAGGIWWGAMFDSVSRDFHIFKYDWAGDRWSDTGVLIDERTNVYLDTLWDGTSLYVASAGTSASSATHSPRLTKFSYNATAKTWSRDTGYPVTPMGNGGVEAVVIAKDSKGLLWATFTQGSKVYVTHSKTASDQRDWVTRYQLPTPAGQSSVDPDDLSAIVSYDGDKVGVLWSNQVAGIETMFWAWHLDGTSDQTWNLQVAYQQPEGADDHINVKSLVGDTSGRVFATAKTSMNNSSDPLINLLVLSTSGQWSATKLWTVKDQGTRAIVQIDSQARQVYVFAAAPCCSGGIVYYKKSGLDNPQFATGLGTPFISSAANPKVNNPTSTKQNVNASTGLVVMGGDDSTRTYLYNRMTLGGTVDTTAPTTTIASGPATSTTLTDATFNFSSNETGSTFSCKLDTGAAETCTSPKSYIGLAAGSHTFTVTATDPAGNIGSPVSRTWTITSAGGTAPETTITSSPAATTTSTGASFGFTSTVAGSTFSCKLDTGTATACTSLQAYSGLAVGSHTFTVAAIAGGITDPTPATHSWTVAVGGATTIFADDFASNGFTVGGWALGVVGSGSSATVIADAVQSAGGLGARLVSTSASGSTSSIRKTFAASQQQLTVSWDAKVVQAGATQNFALAKLYSSSGRVLTLDRNGAAGSLSVRDVGTALVSTGASLPVGAVARFSVTVVQGTTDSVALSVNGVVVYSSSSLNLGTTAFTSVRMGDDSTGRTHDYRVDNVQVSP